jgi:hypothetical protein
VTADQAVEAIVDALEAAGIPYMIVGSLASNVHGVPRSTRDADFVVELAEGSLSRLADALPRDLQLQRQGSFEAVTATTRYLVELPGSPFVGELFVRSDDPHDRERFRRRQRVRLFDRDTFVATAEDMIVTKLRWASEASRAKDREDIRNVLAVRGPDLDLEYVRRWSRAHGTEKLLDEIRATVPPL